MSQKHTNYYTFDHFSSKLIYEPYKFPTPRSFGSHTCQGTHRTLPNDLCKCFSKCYLTENFSTSLSSFYFTACRWVDKWTASACFSERFILLPGNSQEHKFSALISQNKHNCQFKIQVRLVDEGWSDPLKLRLNSNISLRSAHHEGLEIALK